MFDMTEKMDGLLASVKRLYDSEVEDNRKMRDRLANWRKDDDIQKLEKELHHCRRNALVVMSDKEYMADRDFRDKHYKMHNNEKSKRACNTYVYTLSGTGIGTCITVKCPICGEEEDITDIDSW